MALATALAFLLVTAAPGSASVGVSASLSMPGTSAGQQDQVGSFSVTNTNTPPNQSESNIVTEMRIAPSCGTAPSANLCSQPDPGVFSIASPATGAAGTACAGSTFTVSAPDAGGIVTFTRAGGAPVLAPPGGSPGANSCSVNFTFDVLKVPTIDADPPTPGIQTRTNLVATAQGSTSGIDVSARPSLLGTVSRATPSLSTTAADGVVGVEAITDQATVTSGVPAGATGTITFQLYGVGDTACSGAPVFTSVRTLGAGGTATSLGYMAPTVGSYRWRASYSGDANHVAIAAPCNAPNETSTVRAAPVSSVATNQSSVPGDFDDDGFDDLVVAAPQEDSGSTADAGVVHVLYGRAAGVSATGSQRWTQNSTGIDDAAEAGDRFGAALTAGDFNGDGRDDLAIGVPGEDVGAVVDAGVVHVLYGSASGLVTTGSQLWSQDSSAITDDAETGDRFGSALAAGKLNGGRFAELVVGVPGESVATVAGAGVVHVIQGAAAGLTATGSQLWSQSSAGITDTAETGDGFGASLAIGAINSAAGQDLAIGVPDEDVGTVVDGGTVHMLYGSATGLAATGSQYWTQNSSGIADAVETGDRFGRVLATGTLDGDALDELIVGVPDESAGAIAGAGGVHVIPGAASGLTGTGSKYWAQGAGPIGGAAEAGDGFGTSLAVGDLDNQGGEDLAIGVPGQDLSPGVTDAGQVFVLYFSVPGSLDPAAAEDWVQNSAGIGDTRETGDRFGGALAAGSLAGDPSAELVIGVPGESIGAIAGAGIVHVLAGSATGLTGAGSQVWSQNSAGIADAAETGDGFGSAVGG